MQRAEDDTNNMSMTCTKAQITFSAFKKECFNGRLVKKDLKWKKAEGGGWTISLPLLKWHRHYHYFRLSVNRSHRNLEWHLPEMNFSSGSSDVRFGLWYFTSSFNGISPSQNSILPFPKTSAFVSDRKVLSSKLKDKTLEKLSKLFNSAVSPHFRKKKH